jgi:hypothetical protein
VRPVGSGRAGYCDVVSPEGIDEPRRRRELAVIAAAGRTACVWDGGDGDRGDRAQIAAAVGSSRAAGLRREAQELLARPSGRALARRLTEALGGRHELGGRELRDIIVHGKRVRPAWWLGGERRMSERDLERVETVRDGIVTRGTEMLVSTKSFGAIDASGRERCIVTAGRTRVRPHHGVAREYPYAFRAADPEDLDTHDALRTLVARSHGGRSGRAPATRSRRSGREESWRL